MSENDSDNGDENAEPSRAQVLTSVGYLRHVAEHGSTVDTSRPLNAAALRDVLDAAAAHAHRPVDARPLSDPLSDPLSEQITDDGARALFGLHEALSARGVKASREATTMLTQAAEYVRTTPPVGKDEGVTAFGVPLAAMRARLSELCTETGRSEPGDALVEAVRVAREARTRREARFEARAHGEDVARALGLPADCSNAAVVAAAQAARAARTALDAAHDEAQLPASESLVGWLVDRRGWMAPPEDGAAVVSREVVDGLDALGAQLGHRPLREGGEAREVLRDATAYVARGRGVTPAPTSAPTSTPTSTLFEDLLRSLRRELGVSDRSAGATAVVHAVRAAQTARKGLEAAATEIGVDHTRTSVSEIVRELAARARRAGRFGEVARAVGEDVHYESLVVSRVREAFEVSRELVPMIADYCTEQEALDGPDVAALERALRGLMGKAAELDAAVAERDLTTEFIGDLATLQGLTDADVAELMGMGAAEPDEDAAAHERRVVREQVRQHVEEAHGAWRAAAGLHGELDGLRSTVDRLVGSPEGVYGTRGSRLTEVADGLVKVRERVAPGASSAAAVLYAARNRIDTDAGLLDALRAKQRGIGELVGAQAGLGVGPDGEPTAMDVRNAVAAVVAERDELRAWSRRARAALMVAMGEQDPALSVSLVEAAERAAASLKAHRDGDKVAPSALNDISKIVGEVVSDRPLWAVEVVEAVRKVADLAARRRESVTHLEAVMSWLRKPLRGLDGSVDTESGTPGDIAHRVTDALSAASLEARRVRRALGLGADASSSDVLDGVQWLSTTAKAVGRARVRVLAPAGLGVQSQGVESVVLSHVVDTAPGQTHDVDLTLPHAIFDGRFGPDRTTVSDALAEASADAQQVEDAEDAAERLRVEMLANARDKGVRMPGGGELPDDLTPIEVLDATLLDRSARGAGN